MPTLSFLRLLTPWKVVKRILICCQILLILRVIGWWWYPSDQVETSKEGQQKSETESTQVENTTSRRIDEDYYWGRRRQKITEFKGIDMNLCTSLSPHPNVCDRPMKIENMFGLQEKTRINIAAVACGDLEYLQVSLKSILLFGQEAKIHFILFGDEDSMSRIHHSIMDLKRTASRTIGAQFTHELHLLQLPFNPYVDWKHMNNKHCTTQRLFLPTLLPHIDSLIYLDTDTFLLGNLTWLWEEFGHFNEKQIMAMAPDTDIIYHSDKEFPFVPPIGVNAGVMLMNLTRMRQCDFESKIVSLQETLESVMTEADQDMVNVLMHHNPDRIKILDCSFNFIAPHCQNISKDCDHVHTQGVVILHGAGGTFQTYSTSLFTLSYNFMNKFELGEKPRKMLEELTKKYKYLRLRCSTMSPELLLKNAWQYFKNLGQI